VPINAMVTVLAVGGSRMFVRWLLRKIGAVGLVPTIIPLLGSVADENRVSDVILTWKPNIIYHDVSK
jgi:hypothetical protein